MFEIGAEAETVHEMLLLYEEETDEPFPQDLAPGTFGPDDLLVSLRNALRLGELGRENDSLRAELGLEASWPAVDRNQLAEIEAALEHPPDPRHDRTSDPAPRAGAAATGP